MHDFVIGYHKYFDEIVVNNPLGCKHGQKVGAFYFSLVNIPPHLRDWIGNVHVFGFALAADIIQHGINKCLTRLVSDMKLLENGIRLSLHGEEIVLRGTFCKVCADNLAADHTLGFVGSSANFFCRLCMISREEHNASPFIKAY